MNSSTCWELEKKPELTTINRPRMPKGELFDIQHGQVPTSMAQLCTFILLEKCQILQTQTGRLLRMLSP
eukprot:6336859-Amphidinium_carterae.1